MLTYPMFMADEGAVFFIEEPELHLHPGMQRIFMEALSTDVIKEKNLTIFMTTHSNHLVDLLLTERNKDISIFTFHDKGDKKLIRNVKAGDQDILSLLGVTSSSVFLANCSIWVEGPTDRLYIRKFLEEYLESDEYKEIFAGKGKPKESLDYVFFEYGGTLLWDYEFAEDIELDAITACIKAARISSRILVISDKDSIEEMPDLWKARRYKALKGLEGNHFIFRPHTHCREIENYLDADVIFQAAQKTHPDIFKELKREEILEHHYLDTNLWEHLGGLMGKSKAPKVLKMKFCKNALEYISWANMTEEAKDLASDVYAFIQEKGHQEVSTASQT